MTYDRVNWQNEPSENTPLSAENLNKMDSAIKTLSEMVVANPVEADTDELKKIGIEGTIYKIAGGHELVNSSGSTMTQRSKMAFLDTHLTDDSGNNTTKVQVTKEITTAQFLSETEEGLYFFTDMPDSVVTAEQVAYGSGNVKQALDGKVYTGSLNDLTDTGVYGHSVTASSNAPSDVAVGTLLNISVITTSLGITTQIAYYGNMRIYVRRKVYGAWNDWTKLASTWTYLGDKTGTAEIDLPSTWNELLIQITSNNSNLVTYHIYGTQTANYTNTSFGNYGISYAVGSISRTKAKINTVNWAGQDATASAKMYVYYR